MRAARFYRSAFLATALLLVDVCATQECLAQATSTSHGASGCDTSRVAPAGNDSTLRVMLNGVWLAPPYVFEARDRAHWINGRIAVPAPEKVPPPAEVDAAGTIVPGDPKSTLLNRVLALVRDSPAPTFESKIAEALAFLRGSPLVKSAFVLPEGDIRVTWKHDDRVDVVGFGSTPVVTDDDGARADSLSLEFRNWSWNDLVNERGRMLLVEHGREFFVDRRGIELVRAEIEALQRGDSASARRPILPAWMRDEIAARERLRRVPEAVR